MAAAHPEHGPELIEDGGRKYLFYPGRERLGPLPEGIFEPAIRLTDMDRQRVDLQVIAIPPPNFHYHVPPDVGADFARIQNDALIDLSDTQPDRFHVFATLPLQDIEASLDEIERDDRLLPLDGGALVGDELPQVAGPGGERLGRAAAVRSGAQAC